MNNNHTIEIDNSPAARFVKGWMKKDNPHLDQIQLEQKWTQHLEHLNNVARTKAVKRSSS